MRIDTLEKNSQRNSQRIKPTFIKFTPKYTKLNFEFHANQVTRLSNSESENIFSTLNGERTVLINRYSQYVVRYLDGTMVYAITQEKIFFKDIVSGGVISVCQRDLMNGWSPFT